MARMVIYNMKLPPVLKKQLQDLRYNKNVKMAQIIYALLKLAEKYPDDFEHYLWMSKGMFR